MPLLPGVARRWTGMAINRRVGEWEGWEGRVRVGVFSVRFRKIASIFFRHNLFYFIFSDACYDRGIPFFGYFVF